MDEKLYCKTVRRSCNQIGWALMVYVLIMNVAVMIVMFADIMIRMIIQIAEGGSMDALSESAIEEAAGNGWGYLITIALGLLFLRMWKGKEFFRKTLWKTGKPMSVGTFFALVCVFLGCQLLFQFFSLGIEWLLNQFGLSAMAAMESATMTADTFSMFLYIGIGAPIAEEILFRGLVLRCFEPYGKGFAVFFSAFLFGMFHANIVQIPFAFGVGLVLGYTAIEYGIGWAMLLHMINNLVLSDMLGRLTSGLPAEIADGILGLIIMGSALAAVIILLVKHRKVGTYLKENPIGKINAKAFFTAPSNIVFHIYVLINVILMIVMTS